MTEIKKDGTEEITISEALELADFLIGNGIDFLQKENLRTFKRVRFQYDRNAERPPQDIRPVSIMKYEKAWEESKKELEDYKGWNDGILCPEQLYSYNSRLIEDLLGKKRKKVDFVNAALDLDMFSTEVVGNITSLAIQFGLSYSGALEVFMDTLLEDEEMLFLEEIKE